MGALDDAEGKAKEAVGDLKGDERLKIKGKVDRAKGKVKDAVDHIVDKIAEK